MSSLDTREDKNLIGKTGNVVLPFYSIEKLGTRSNVDPIINKNESISSIESKKS